MTSKEVYSSLCNHAKVFVRKYHDDTLEQKQIDTTIVEFINRFALMQSSLYLNFSVEDLYGEKQTEDSISTIDLDKEIIGPNIEYWRWELYHDDDNALRVITEFVKDYLSC